MHEAQIRANVVHLISTGEDLGTELTADVSICGELRNQDASTDACRAVVSERQRVPSTTQTVVHGDAGSRLERVLP